MDRKKRILVVEDDPAIAKGLKELLLAEDYAVEVCKDGRSGLKQGLTSIPDLVLLDVGLPKLGGFEVLRQLRAGGFTNRIVMLTSSSAEVDKVVALDEGANDYVTKPFSSRELLARIRAHVRTIPSQKEHAERKLVAIMFTDMVGYSKKMNEDENLGLTLLRTQNDLISHAVATHGGTVVETIGDAFHVSFESAVVAVQCAVEIQQRLKTYRHAAPPAHHIHARIGLHLGDVTIVDNGIRGDAVNIAARVQQHASSDGIYISESLFKAIRAINGDTKYRFRDLGEHHLKNIRQPVRLYAVVV